MTTNTKTYLITGGAGFLGINLARYLLERGHKVVSLDIADFDYLERNRVKIVKGDIRDRSAVDRAMEGVQIVVHTAAALPLYKTEDIFSTDLDGTRPDAWRYIVEHRDRGLPADDTGYR